MLKTTPHPFFLQKILNKFLYKGHTVNNTTLHALNEISIAAT